MLVKAKWNVKDAAGWHKAGDVFHTDQDLGDGVEVLDAPKRTEPVKEPDPAAEPVKESVPAAEPAKETPKPTEEKPKAQRRRK